MKDKILRILFTFFIGYPLYAISFLFPRKKGRWVFGSGKSFSDNAKYLFLDVIENHPKIEAIWISQSKKTTKDLRNKGIRAYYYWSLKGLYYSLTASVFCVSHYPDVAINFWTMGRGIYIQLWHGIGLKNLIYKSYSPWCRKTFHNPLTKILYAPFSKHIRKKADIFLATSRVMKQHFMECYRLKSDNMILAPYPRVNIFNMSEIERKRFIKLYEPQKTQNLIKDLKKYDEVFIYMPTWREKDPHYIKTANFNFSDLNKVLQKKNALFIFKLHFLTPKGDLKEIKKYSNIMALDNELDVYPILPYTSTLITDYSSIYYDYLLLNKSSIFFNFDYEKYLKNRDLAFNYEDNISGPIAKNFQELLNILKNERYKNINKTKINRIKSFFWGEPEEKEGLLNVILQLEEQ